MRGFAYLLAALASAVSIISARPTVSTQAHLALGARVGEGADPTSGAFLKLMPCNASSSFQQWQYRTNDTTILWAGSGGNNMCIDIDNYGVTDGSMFWTYTCHQDDKVRSRTRPLVQRGPTPREASRSSSSTGGSGNLRCTPALIEHTRKHQALCVEARCCFLSGGPVAAANEARLTTCAHCLACRTPPSKTRNSTWMSTRAPSFLT